VTLRHRTPGLVAALALLVALMMTACGQAHQAPAKHNGTVTFAEQPGGQPFYIFPLANGSNLVTVNVQQFQYLMYLPLYWFGKNGEPILNEALSPAYPPTYSDNNQVVTIRMKDWRWSNGTEVDARDVAFWMNLLEQEKVNFGAYLPGSIPDNVASYQILSQSTIQFRLTHSVSSTWFTDNQLTEITPLPLAWDKESANGPVGNWDDTPAGAKAVYSFLINEAKNTAAYATNPLWQVVDGPWHLARFVASTGYADFRPNEDYSGPRHPRISNFIEEPFTSDAAEYSVLRAGNIDYGYVPESDLDTEAALKAKGYAISSWPSWAFSYFEMDYNNPAAGPLFQQLYIRQAMQRLVNQPEIIKDVYGGYATPTYGPVPVEPKSPYVSSLEEHASLPYSPDAAVKLLADHGWKVSKGGVTTCQSPGSGSTACGAGIASGTPLTFQFLYAAGISAVSQTVAILQSTFRQQAGIQLDLRSEPANTLVGATLVCAGTHKIAAACNWQMAYVGAPTWYYEPDFYPTGGELYGTDSAYNGDGYSNAAADRLIAATHAPGATVRTLFTYENYMIEQSPEIFVPTPPYQISAYRNTLRGITPQDPLLNLYPQNWAY